MRAFTVVVASAGCAVLLAACSSSSGGATAGGGGSSTSSSPTTSATASESPSSTEGVAVATNLNPCKLVTRSEASKLAGVSLAAGKLDTHNGGKTCVYSGSAASVFTVEVAVARTAQDASAVWDQQQARAQDELKKSVPAGISVKYDTTSLSGLGDKAAAVRATTKFGGQQFSVSGIYVLKGSTFFGFQDLAFGKTATSESDMKGEAQTVLGRI